MSESKLTLNESVQHDENMCSIPYYEISVEGSFTWLAHINAISNPKNLEWAKAFARAPSLLIENEKLREENERIKRALERISNMLSIGGFETFEMEKIAELALTNKNKQ